MNNEILDRLVIIGVIQNYEYMKEYETPGRDIQTTEKLVLEFKTGDKLEINTICSGCLENTSMDFIHK